MYLIVFGAHPDDPDSGAGGLIARYTSRGHRVLAVSLTKGELCTGARSPEENERINVEEAIEAFRLLGASVKFLNFKDASVYVTPKGVDEIRNLLQYEEPDIVLTHWPIDTHSDHRATGVMTISAIQALPVERRPKLYFYEVMTGRQSRCFIPDVYVDVTEYAELKRKAVYCHRNCKPESWYPIHERMMEFRGLEMGVKYAEAFVAFDKRDIDHLIVN